MPTKTNTTRRINISLSEHTINLLERVAPKGQKSRVIAEALEYYVENRGKDALREAIISGAKARAARDLEIADEWFILDSEQES